MATVAEIEAAIRARLAAAPGLGEDRSGESVAPAPAALPPFAVEIEETAAVRETMGPGGLEEVSALAAVKIWAHGPAARAGARAAGEAAAAAIVAGGTLGGLAHSILASGSELEEAQREVKVASIGLAFEIAFPRAAG